jgi:hypothetical protein
MRLKHVFALVLGFFAFHSAAANAVPITYIFHGTGSGVLGGTVFNGGFSVTLVGDTVNVVNGSPNYFTNSAVTASFTTGSLVAIMPNTSIQIIGGLVDPNGSNVSFPQSQPAPVFAVNTALFNTAFNTYDLTTAFALTPGGPSFLQDPYVTNIGNLSFATITDMSFEAIAATPIPAALPMFLMALSGLGLLAAKRRSA